MPEVPEAEPRMRRALAVGLGASVLLAYALHHPLDGSPWPEPWPLSLPHPGRLLSLLHAVGVLSLLNVSAYALGAVLGPLHPERVLPAALAVPLRLGLGLLVVANAVLLLAATHLLRPWALVSLLALPALVWTLRKAREGGSDSLTRIRSVTSRIPVWAALALGFLLIVPFLRAFGPGVGWDALTYHLAIPERYLFFNGIHVTPFSTYTTFPLSTQMLYLVGLATTGPALAKLIHLEFGCLILWTLFTLGRSRSRRGGWLAVLFLVSDPVFVWELTLAYSDLSLAFYALVAVALTERWWATGERVPLLLAGLLCGACLATRYPGGAVLVALVTVVALMPGPRSWRERATAAVVIAALALAVLSPWLVRNLVFTGNPIAPALQGLFHAPGEEYFDPVAVDQQLAFSRSMGMGRTLGALLLLPWTLTMRPTGSYTDGFGFHIGPLTLISILLVAFTPRRPPLVRLSLATSGVLTLVWFATSQESRFLLPAYVLLALCGAWALDRLMPPSARHPMSVLWALPLLAVLHCHWPMWGGVGSDYADALVRTESELDRAYGPAQVMGSRLRRELQGPHRILLLFESRAFLFRGLDYVPYHINEGSPTLQLVHRSRSPADLQARLAALGVTHLVLNPLIERRYKPVWVEGYGPEDYRSDLALISSFWQDCTRPVWQEEEVVAAALLPACRPAGEGRVALPAEPPGAAPR